MDSHADRHLYPDFDGYLDSTGNAADIYIHDDFHEYVYGDINLDPNQYSDPYINRDEHSHSDVDEYQVLDGYEYRDHDEFADINIHPNHKLHADADQHPATFGHSYGDSDHNGVCNYDPHEYSDSNPYLDIDEYFLADVHSKHDVVSHPYTDKYDYDDLDRHSHGYVERYCHEHDHIDLTEYFHVYHYDDLYGDCDFDV
jgi:hypothetical protein